MIDTKTLKPGDEVAVTRYNYGNRSYEIRTVTKVSPTGQVTLSNGWRFNNIGYLIGSSDDYNRSSIVTVTDEIREVADRQRLLVCVTGMAGKWSTLPTDALRQIAEIIRANTPTGDAKPGDTPPPTETE